MAKGGFHPASRAAQEVAEIRVEAVLARRHPHCPPEVLRSLGEIVALSDAALRKLAYAG